MTVARQCPFDQLIVTLGGAAEEVRAAVELDGIDAVIAKDFGGGCASSLRVALTRVDPGASGIVLLLGDQPGVQPSAVARLITGRGTSSIAVCRYSDGIGHPFWLGREVFGDLARMHGDKGVWKLVEKASASGGLTEVPVATTVPLDVNTGDDYQRLLNSATKAVPT